MNAEERPRDSYGGYRLETLERLPRVERGDLVECPSCGEAHLLYGARQLFVLCGGESTLASIGGRLVLGTPPDAGP